MDTPLEETLTDEKARSLMEQIALFEVRLDGSSGACSVKALHQKLQALKERPSARGMGQITSVHKLHMVVHNEHERVEADFEVGYNSDPLLQYFDWYLDFLDFLRDLKAGFDDRIYTPLKCYFMDKRYVTPLPVRTVSRASTLLSITMSRDSSRSAHTPAQGLDALKDDFGELADIYENNEIIKLSAQLHKLNDQWTALLDYDTELCADMFEIDIPLSRIQNGGHVHRDVSNLIRLVPDIIMKGKRSIYVAKRWIRCYSDRSQILEEKLQKLTLLQQKMASKLTSVAKEIQEKEKQLADTSQAVDWLVKREERSDDINIQIFDTEQNMEKLQIALDETTKEKQRLAAEMLANKQQDREALALQKLRYEENKLKRYIIERKLKTANYRHQILNSDLSVEMEVKPSIIRFTNDAQEKYEQLEKDLDQKQRLKRKIEQALGPIQTDQRVLDSRLKGTESMPEFPSILSASKSMSVTSSPFGTPSPPREIHREPVRQQEHILPSIKATKVFMTEIRSPYPTVPSASTIAVVDEEASTAREEAREEASMQIAALPDPQPEQQPPVEPEPQPQPKPAKKPKPKPAERPPWQHTFKPTTIGKQVAGKSKREKPDAAVKKAGPKKADTNKVKTEITTPRSQLSTHPEDPEVASEVATDRSGSHPNETTMQAEILPTNNARAEGVTKEHTPQTSTPLHPTSTNQVVQSKSLSEQPEQHAVTASQPTHPQNPQEGPLQPMHAHAQHPTHYQTHENQAWQTPQPLDLSIRRPPSVSQEPDARPWSGQARKQYELEQERLRWQQQQNEQQQLLIKQQQELIQQQQQILLQSQQLVKPLLEVQQGAEKRSPYHGYPHVPHIVPQPHPSESTQQLPISVQQMNDRKLSTTQIPGHLQEAQPQQNAPDESLELDPQQSFAHPHSVHPSNATEPNSVNDPEQPHNGSSHVKPKPSVQLPRQNNASKLRQLGKLDSKQEEPSSSGSRADVRPKQPRGKSDQYTRQQRLSQEQAGGRLSKAPASNGYGNSRGQDMRPVRALRRVSSVADFSESSEEEEIQQVPPARERNPNKRRGNANQNNYAQPAVPESNPLPKSILKKDVDLPKQNQPAERPIQKDSRVVPKHEPQKPKPKTKIKLPQPIPQIKHRPPTPRKPSLEDDEEEYEEEEFEERQNVRYAPSKIPVKVPEDVPKYKNPFLAYGQFPEHESRVRAVPVPVSQHIGSTKKPVLRPVLGAPREEDYDGQAEEEEEEEWSSSAFSSADSRYREHMGHGGKVRFNEHVDVVNGVHRGTVPKYANRNAKGAAR